MSHNTAFVILDICGCLWGFYLCTLHSEWFVLFPFAAYSKKVRIVTGTMLDEKPEHGSSFTQLFVASIWMSKDRAHRRRLKNSKKNLIHVFSEMPLPPDNAIVEFTVEEVFYFLRNKSLLKLKSWKIIEPPLFDPSAPQ